MQYADLGAGQPGHVAGQPDGGVTGRAGVDGDEYAVEHGLLVLFLSAEGRPVDGRQAGRPADGVPAGPDPRPSS
ncbi:hypothetical protein GCM10018772_28900 [Streptomyces fumanus]|uniref:Uncharacterized protein n=1 Tax=Streptomyces fumanus TaxID=67302 RepID=A0A919AF53_9ACTN|nr:hypothetical protein GCM10018772_28900 [Streptomyces fumanus]